MWSNFGDYFAGVKKLRTKDNYRYTDEELEKHSSWIEVCYKKNISCYKCLEMLWFETEEGKNEMKKMYGI